MRSAQRDGLHKGWWLAFPVGSNQPAIEIPEDGGKYA